MRIFKIAIDYFKSNKNIRDIISNISWLLFDSVFRLGITAILFIYLARYLGPSEFGIFNY